MEVLREGALIWQGRRRIVTVHAIGRDTFTNTGISQRPYKRHLNGDIIRGTQNMDKWSVDPFSLKLFYATYHKRVKFSLMFVDFKLHCKGLMAYSHKL